MSRRNVNHDPNGNGENWGRFLKDIQDPQVIGILNDDPAMRLNRGSARANGFKNKEEALQEAIERGKIQAQEADIIRRGRAQKMGEFYAEVFDAVLPKWAYAAMVGGRRWIGPLFGYVWGNTPGNVMDEESKTPKLLPCNTCWVARRRFIWFGAPIQVTYMKKDSEGVLKETPGATKFIWEKA